MHGHTAKDAKIKAYARCNESNTQKRGKRLVALGHSRQISPHKGPASQKPAKPKSAFRLTPGQKEEVNEQRQSLKRKAIEALLVGAPRFTRSAVSPSCSQRRRWEVAEETRAPYRGARCHPSGCGVLCAGGSGER